MYDGEHWAADEDVVFVSFKYARFPAEQELLLTDGIATEPIFLVFRVSKEFQAFRKTRVSSIKERPWSGYETTLPLLEVIPTASLYGGLFI